MLIRPKGQIECQLKKIIIETLRRLSWGQVYSSQLNPIHGSSLQEIGNHYIGSAGGSGVAGGVGGGVGRVAVGGVGGLDDDAVATGSSASCVSSNGGVTTDSSGDGRDSTDGLAVCADNCRATDFIKKGFGAIGGACDDVCLVEAGDRNGGDVVAGTVAVGAGADSLEGGAR